MQYSFGILCYNHEWCILELLESIKYQIQNYGDNIEVFLYLSDDASQDKTVVIASNWLEENKLLFKKYEIITTEINKGTTNSYSRLLDKIKTEFFKVIAGDDVFSQNDIFEELKKGKKGEAIAYVPLILKDGKLEIPENLLYNNLIHVNKKRTHGRDLNNMRFGGYFNTPSFFPTRSLINEKCIDFMRKFLVFEDDPTWYMLIKTNENLVITFNTQVKVLYRMHSATVSNSENISEKWYNDSIKLIKYYLKENKNIVLHLYLRAHMRDLNNRYLKKKNKGYIGYRIIDKVRRIITKQIGMHYMTRELNMQFQRECMKNQEYYNLIKEKAEANYKRIKEKLQYD